MRLMLCDLYIYSLFSIKKNTAQLRFCRSTKNNNSFIPVVRHMDTIFWYEFKKNSNLQYCSILFVEIQYIGMDLNYYVICFELYCSVGIVAI